MAYYNSNNVIPPPSVYVPTEFTTKKVVVLSDLSAREREKWYNFITENNIEVSKTLDESDPDMIISEAPTASGDNDTRSLAIAKKTKYVAKVRLVVPGVSKDKAIPPSMRVSNNYKAHYPKQNSSTLAVTPLEKNPQYGLDNKSSKSPSNRSNNRSDRSYSTSTQNTQSVTSSKKSIQHWDRVFHFRSEVIDLAEYRQFISLLRDVGPECARPRVMSWVMRGIEDIYDARYIHDTVELTNDDGLDDLDDEATAALTNRSSLDFPKFVVEFFFKRFGMRNLVEQNCWELILNVAVMRRESLAMELFSRFMMERYDADDLLFFLYVRYTVQKTLNFNFKARWADGRSSKAQREADLWLSYRECFTISKTVFGNDQDPMCREFLHMVESQLVGKKRSGASGHDTRRIEVYQFLLLAVSTYHDARPDDGDGSYAATTNNSNNGTANSDNNKQYDANTNEQYNIHTNDTRNYSTNNMINNLQYGSNYPFSIDNFGGGVLNTNDTSLNLYLNNVPNYKSRDDNMVESSLYELGNKMNMMNNYAVDGINSIGEINKEMEIDHEKMQVLIKDIEQNRKNIEGLEEQYRIESKGEDVLNLKEIMELIQEKTGSFLVHNVSQIQSNSPEGEGRQAITKELREKVATTLYDRVIENIASLGDKSSYTIEKKILEEFIQNSFSQKDISQLLTSSI